MSFKIAENFTTRKYVLYNLNLNSILTVIQKPLKTFIKLHAWEAGAAQVTKC